MRAIKRPEDDIPLTKGQSDLIKQIVDTAMADKSLKTAFDITRLSRELTRRCLEAMLNGEMNHHLAEEAQAQAPANKRNGKHSKRLVSDDGKSLEIDVPRDRNGTFVPQIVPPYSRRLPGFDEKVIALYARGMTTREITAFIRDEYGVELSAAAISEITDSVLKDIEEWRSRPLKQGYPVVFFDAIRIKIRQGATIASKAVHIAFGITATGHRDVLGLWIMETESATTWRSVFTNLQTRGVKDIILVVTDGLKGMTEAIGSAFPEAAHQTCIVHLLRTSAGLVGYKDRKAVCDALKPVYQAPDVVAAEEALEAFGESDLGQKHPYIVDAWRRQWAQVVPFFQYSPELRRLVYTTNAIEGLNRSIRKIIKTRAVFPTDDAAMKLVWLAMKNATNDWSRRVHCWSQVQRELVVLYGERFTRMLEA